MKPAAPDTAGTHTAGPAGDDTVKIVRKPASPTVTRSHRGLALAFGGALVVGIGAGTAAWLFWQRSAPLVVKAPAVAPVATPAIANLPAVPQPPEFAIQSANEAQIRDNNPTGIAIFRLAANPNILILDFSSLLEQGLMLNRLGAFAEKAGAPHDRVLADAELDQIVRAGGDTVETFYYGHDYSAATIARFFKVADRDRVALNPQEEGLRRLMRQEGWLADGKAGGLISVPRVGADGHLTAEARATILHHELSHGEYFSNPAYVAYVHQFWTTTLTAPERDAVRKYLRSESYDIGIDDLIENEAQAYLVFTLNPAFFTPAMVGMTEARRSDLRTTFLRDVPALWLKDSLPPRSGVEKAAAH